MPVYKYSLPVILDGFTSQVNVDVSAFVMDARQGLWVFYDIDGTEIVGAAAPITATTVQVTVQPAPAQGTYKLVGLQ